MTINYTANTDFNSDGEFSECELDTSWATLQVKKLLDTSGSTSIEIGGQTFDVYDNLSFLNAVKAMIALNVSASIATDGCAVADSLPVSVVVPEQEFSFENPVAFWRLNDPFVDDLGGWPGSGTQQYTTSFYDSVSGNRNATIDGWWQWSWYNKDDRYEHFIETSGDLKLPVGSDLGNDEWTVTFRFKPFNSNEQGVVFNKSDKLKVEMYSNSIFIAQVQPGGFSATYPNNNTRPDGSDWVYFALVHSKNDDTSTQLSLYLDGELVGTKQLWNDIFDTGETDELKISIDGEIRDVFLCASVADISDIQKLTTRPLPLIPKFYTNFRRGSWLGDRHGIVFRGKELKTILNWDSQSASDSLIRDVGDETDSGPNGQVVRKAFDCRGKYNAKLEDIVDMSKNFTISMWIMPTSTWSDKAIQITDGSNTLSISLVGGTSKGEGNSLWCEHSSGCSLKNKWIWSRWNRSTEFPKRSLAPFNDYEKWSCHVILFKWNLGFRYRRVIHRSRSCKCEQPRIVRFSAW